MRLRLIHARMWLLGLLLALLGAFRTRQQRAWLIAAGVTLGAFMLNRENARILYPIRMRTRDASPGSGPATTSSTATRGSHRPTASRTAFRIPTARVRSARDISAVAAPNGSSFSSLLWISRS